MAEDNEDSGSEGYGQHPALKNFSRTGFMIKHVLKNTLKWGAVGALIGGGGLLAAGLAATWAAGTGLLAGIPALIGAMVAVPWIAIPAAAIAGIGAYFFGPGLVTGLLTKAAIGGLVGGGLVGAAVGGVVALSGASEAADAEEDKLVARYEQQQARRDRMAALEQRRDQQRYAMEQQSAGMRSPGMQIPYGRQRPQQGPGQAYT